MNIRILLWWTFVAFSLLLVCCVGVGSAIFYANYPFDDREFSADEWKACDAHNRGYMVSSLLRGHIQRDMTEEQVIALLGIEFEVKEKGDNLWPTSVAKNKCYMYRVGSWGNWAMDDAFVLVFFDDNGRVISAKLDGYYLGLHTLRIV